MVELSIDNNKNLELSNEEVKEIVKAKIENRIDSFPYGFWRCKNGKEHSKIAIKFLIEEHLELELHEVPDKVSSKTFHETGLFRLLVEFFDSSYFKALDFVYPNKFKPWEFNKGMTGIWDGEKGKERSIKAIKQMIADLEISSHEIPKKIKYNTFKEFGLGGMLQTLYNSSPFLAINELYPNQFKPWEFHVKNFWKDKPIELAQEATRWLIGIKLKYSEKQLEEVRRKDFLENSLGQMLKIFYKNSHIRALIDAYPNYLKS